MESAYNFRYVPKYLTDDFLFTKTYFKNDKRFILDLPKNKNLQFVTSKVMNSGFEQKVKIGPSRVFRRGRNLLRLSSSGREVLNGYLTLTDSPNVTLRYWIG